jgi:hypothetical protein
MVVVVVVAALSCSHTSEAMLTPKIIFSGLENPRGADAGPAGDLFVTGCFGLALI